MPRKLNLGQKKDINKDNEQTEEMPPDDNAAWSREGKGRGTFQVILAQGHFQPGSIGHTVTSGLIHRASIWDCFGAIDSIRKEIMPNNSFLGILCSLGDDRGWPCAIWLFWAGTVQARRMGTEFLATLGNRADEVQTRCPPPFREPGIMTPCVEEKDHGDSSKHFP